MILDALVSRFIDTTSKIMLNTKLKLQCNIATIVGTILELSVKCIFDVSSVPCIRVCPRYNSALKIWQHIRPFSE